MLTFERRMSSRDEAIWKSFAILPKVGGMLSIFGEFFLVRDIGMKIKAKGAQSVPLTSLLLLLISIGSIPYSFFVSFMSTWMVPPLSEGDYMYVPPQFATGTVETCTVQGLISTIGMFGFALHYALLSVLCELQLNYTVNICFVCFIIHQNFFLNKFFPSTCRLSPCGMRLERK